MAQVNQPVLNMDSTIDDRLDQLAVAWFGEPEAAEEFVVDHVARNPFQRVTVVPYVRSVAATIREEGFQRRLWLRRRPGTIRRYQLLFGQQWTLAAMQIFLLRMPGVLVNADDDAMMEFALVEALLRKPLAPEEEAQMLAWLLDRQHYTLETLAAWLDREPESIEERLTLL